MTTNHGDEGPQGDLSNREAGMPDSVREAARVAAERREKGTQKPVWLDKFVWQSLWKVFAVVAGSAVILILVLRTHS